MKTRIETNMPMEFSMSLTIELKSSITKQTKEPSSTNEDVAASRQQPPPRYCRPEERDSGFERLPVVP